MKKIEQRALGCRILALLLAAGLCLFLARYFRSAGDWASSPFNRHLYNTEGQLAAGTVPVSYTLVRMRTICCV